MCKEHQAKDVYVSSRNTKNTRVQWVLFFSRAPKIVKKLSQCVETWCGFLARFSVMKLSLGSRRRLSISGQGNSKRMALSLGRTKRIPSAFTPSRTELLPCCQQPLKSKKKIDYFLAWQERSTKLYLFAQLIWQQVFDEVWSKHPFVLKSAQTWKMNQRSLNTQLSLSALMILNKQYVFYQSTYVDVRTSHTQSGSCPFA